MRILLKGSWEDINPADLKRKVLAHFSVLSSDLNSGLYTGVTPQDGDGTGDIDPSPKVPTREAVYTPVGIITSDNLLHFTFPEDVDKLKSDGMHAEALSRNKQRALLQGFEWEWEKDKYQVSVTPQDSVTVLVEAEKMFLLQKSGGLLQVIPNLRLQNGTQIPNFTPEMSASMFMQAAAVRSQIEALYT